jgi:pyrroloquinoline quinone biosynthesis protein D
MMKNITRNPDVVWREEESIRDEIIAASERGEDATAEGAMLLIVAGMMHQLNLLGSETWKLLDGLKDEQMITEELFQIFDVDKETLAADVHTFLDDIAKRGWISYDE